MQKPVTELAVKRRLNRRLAGKGECLRKCSSNSPWLSELGSYYIAEIDTNNVIQTDVDLEVLAREEGAMKSGEAITAELQWLAPL
jgi:hypothetical protein